MDVSLPILTQRLAKDTTRPLLQTTDLSLKIQSLSEQRNPLYAQSDLRIIIDREQTADDTVEQILELIPTVIKTKSEISQEFN